MILIYYMALFVAAAATWAGALAIPVWLLIVAAVIPLAIFLGWMLFLFLIGVVALVTTKW